MKLIISKLYRVKSTNDEAIKLIKKNKTKIGILLAESQDKGRGTMGKKWVSLRGNLFLSIFFQIDFNKIKLNQITILNPHIIKNILRKYSKYKIQIKKPNDILIKKKKLCGILQEVIDHKTKKEVVENDSLQTNDECTICMDKKCDGVALPCRHAAFCHDCIDDCKSREGTCPMCREPIEQIIKIFR